MALKPSRSRSPMEAIILAGGLGTRLRAVVGDVPKPMAPVAGRPFLSFVLDQLVDAGFAKAILAVGYQAESIRSHFGDVYRGLPLAYSVENGPQGTGGALRLASAYTRNADIFVLNGDTYLELDFRAMHATHKSAGTDVTIAVHKAPDVGRFGALDIDNGIVRGFREKGCTGPGWINGGTYLLARALLDRLPQQRSLSLERDVLMAEVSQLSPVAFITAGLFIDIGVPGDYARADALFSSYRLRARHD